MLAGPRAAEAMGFGQHGSTFGGNPLAAAVALVALRELSSPALLANVGRQAQALRDGLAGIDADLGLFQDIRGRGLMIGAQLRAGYAGQAGAVVEQCIGHGLLMLQAGPDVLRFVPALNITDTDVAEGLARLRSALTSDATGREPGVASLNGGVVVAYRHTTTAGTQLALALLNSRAELVKTELLGTTTALGGPVSVAVNNEGIIRIAWAEIDAGTTTTYSQAIVCTGLPADL